MNKKPILSRIRSATRVGKEIFAQMPLVEIAGQNRALLENHMGVLAYSPEEIEVKVNYGKLTISGMNLRFSQISRDQLVIHGHIEAVKLQRRQA